MPLADPGRKRDSTTITTDLRPVEVGERLLTVAHPPRRCLTGRGQAAKLGDAAWRALLDRHDHTVREQVGLFGGKLTDHTGDGSLSIFENPRHVIECALALQRALADIGVEVRSGVHFGEIERRVDGGVGGVNVQIGARVMALAGADEVLISRTVRYILIGSRYEFEDRGTDVLKGVPDRWQLYAAGERKRP